MEKEVSFPREKAVCFTGHRIISDEMKEVLFERVSKAIEIYIRRGFVYFITGGAIGFDSIAAECIMAARKKHPHIKHILALPCRDQTAKWKKSVDIAFYKKVLGEADEVIYVENMYKADCMHKRNRFMVDNSTVCIAYMAVRRGGTGYTCNYAEKSGIELINLGPVATQITFC